MKKITFLGLIISSIILSCAAQESKFPQGTWNLVYAKSISGDKIVREFPSTTLSGSNLVIISGTHFLSVGKFKLDTTVFNNYVGAKYTLKGNHSEETLLYFPNQDQVDEKVKSILELHNDTLVKTYPVNDNWAIDKSNYNVEKYVRVK